MKKCHNKLFKTKLSGVSLVELLVVSAITVMVMLTIARLFQRSMRDAVRAREMEAAERVMSEMMTELRKTEFVFVMPADSLKKGGAPNINSHNSAFSDYNVSWVQSPMLAVLNRLEVLVRSAGFTSFSIGVAPLMRYNVTDEFNLTKMRWFMDGGGGQDSRDPNLRFVDNLPSGNPDGDYWDVLFDPVTQQWLSEWPKTNAKSGIIRLFKGSSLFATRDFFLVKGEMSSDSLQDNQSPLPLVIDWPPSFEIEHFGYPLYHQRNNQDERDSLDLVITKNPLPKFNLYSCREKRFDDYNDPVKGLGGFVLHGVTSPGATVTVTHRGVYYPPPHYTTVSTPDNDNPNFQMVLTADAKGEFLGVTDAHWGDVVRGEWGTLLYTDNSLMNGFWLRGQKGVLHSQLSSIMTFYSYFWPSGTPVTVLQGPVIVSNVNPSVGSVVKTLAPDIFLESSRVVDTPTLTIKRDGVERNVWNQLIEVEQWNTRVNHSVVHEVVATEGTYANLPPVLQDGTSYTIFSDFADLACYKTSHTWTFSVQLDNDVTIPDINNANLFPSIGGQTRPKGFMRCVIEDPESGVDYRTIGLKIDGVVVIPVGGVTRDSYDPFTGELRYPLIKMSLGIHNITVTAKNFRGLAVTKNDWMFRVY